MNAKQTEPSLTRRNALKGALVLGTVLLAEATGGNPSASALSRRSTRESGRNRDRERRPRRPRRPKISARYDAATSSVVVSGEKFSENVRVDIRVDYDWPFLDYSVPWPIPTASSVKFTNNHGKFNQSVHISPLGILFTGRVEVVDSESGMTASKNFNGS